MPCEEAAGRRQADRHEAGRPEAQGRHAQPALGAGPDVGEPRAAVAAGQRRRLPLGPIDQQDALAGGRGDGSGDVGGDQAADQRGQPPDDRDDLGAAHVGRLLVRAGEAADQHAAQVEQQQRRLGGGLEEPLARDHPDDGRGDRADAGRAGLAGQDGHLAERLAGAEAGQDGGLTGRAVEEDLDQARLDDEQRVAGIAFADDDGVRRALSPLEKLDDRGDVRRRDAAKERARQQRRRHFQA